MCSQPLSILPPAREVLPLAVVPSVYVVVGAACLPMPAATDPLGPQLHLQPFAHAHVRHLLLRDELDEAVRCATSLPLRRRHSLELLLHEALLEAAEESTRAQHRSAASEDGDSAKTTTPRSRVALLDHVAGLIRRLPSRDWCQIVSGCARKTDALHWPDLFAVCGAPSEVIQACLDAGHPRCAAMLLLPLRSVDGTAACSIALHRVLHAAEARQLTALSNQLKAFDDRLRQDLEGTSSTELPT